MKKHFSIVILIAMLALTGCNAFSNLSASEPVNPELTEEEKAMFLGKNAEIFYGFKDLVELPYIKNMSE